MYTRFSVIGGRLVLFLGLLVSTFSMAAPAEKEKNKDTTVRFLCVGESPPKYKRAPDGGYITLPYEFGEVAPGAVYLKSGGAFEQKPFLFYGISEPHVLKIGKTEHEGYFIDGEPPKTERTSDATGVHYVTKQSEDAAKRVKLANLPPLDGGEHLVCFFQPHVKSKWYPPKVLYIDTGAALFPSGKLLIVNLSASNLFVQVGVAGKPFPMKPGVHLMADVPADTSASTRVKIVEVSESKQVIAYNRGVTLSKDRRSVLTVSSAPAAEEPVRVNIFALTPPRLQPVTKP